MKKYMTALATAVAVAMISGCELDKVLKKPENSLRKPAYVISVHRIVKYPRAEKLERKISTFSGREIYVNANPFLHSRDIKKIELIEREDQKLSPNQMSFNPDTGDDSEMDEEEEDELKDGKEPIDPNSLKAKKEGEPRFYDLKVYLTRRGALMWMQLSVGFRHEKLAFVVDGVFYRTFLPGKVTTEKDEWAIIEGPFDETCAKAIEKNAKFNFKKYNKQAKSLW